MYKIPFRHISSFILLAIILSLAACSTIHTTRKDGPPPFDVDASKIPDAVPKEEKLSKLGNKPYHVFGKPYYVMSSSKNYEERGIASWYGTKFHEQRTSSGERYNMLAMTAAHKTLPLPTYVQVTNLKNGKKIIVKVNDRGPFEANRLIDLSYVAAKKLGMLGHGTAYVDIKAIDPLKYDRNNFDRPAQTRDFYLAENTVHSPTVHPTPHHPTSAVYLQVGAFKNKILAEQMKKRLDNMLSSPIKVTQLASHKTNLYRVQIGPIKDVATAKHITQRLQSAGLHSKQMQAEA